LYYPTGSIYDPILGKFSGYYLARLSQKFTLEEKKKGYVTVYNIPAGGVGDALG
jgi:hypothetical protein